MKSKSMSSRLWTVLSSVWIYRVNSDAGHEKDILDSGYGDNGGGLLWPGNAPGAGGSSDDFIAGYATAVLAVKFDTRTCSVDVTDGVITVSGTDLGADAREKAAEQLKQIGTPTFQAG